MQVQTATTGIDLVAPAAAPATISSDGAFGRSMGRARGDDASPAPAALAANTAATTSANTTSATAATTAGASTATDDCCGGVTLMQDTAASGSVSPLRGALAAASAAIGQRTDVAVETDPVHAVTLVQPTISSDDVDMPEANAAAVDAPSDATASARPDAHASSTSQTLAHRAPTAMGPDAPAVTDLADAAPTAASDADSVTEAPREPSTMARVLGHGRAPSTAPVAGGGDGVASANAVADHAITRDGAGDLAEFAGTRHRGVTPAEMATNAANLTVALAQAVGQERRPATRDGADASPQPTARAVAVVAAIAEGASANPRDDGDAAATITPSALEAATLLAGSQLPASQLPASQLAAPQATITEADAPRVTPTPMDTATSMPMHIAATTATDVTAATAGTASPQSGAAVHAAITAVAAAATVAAVGPQPQQQATSGEGRTAPARGTIDGADTGWTTGGSDADASLMPAATHDPAVSDAPTRAPAPVMIPAPTIPATSSATSSATSLGMTTATVAGALDVARMSVDGDAGDAVDAAAAAPDAAMTLRPATNGTEIALPMPSVGEVSTPVGPAVAQAANSIAARVEAAVEALRNAPPPREAVLDVDGLRVTVRLVGDVVHVSTDQQLQGGLGRELGQALAGRGLQLGDGTNSQEGEGQASSGRQDEQDSSPRNAQRSGAPANDAPTRRDQGVLL